MLPNILLGPLVGLYLVAVVVFVMPRSPLATGGTTVNATEVSQDSLEPPSVTRLPDQQSVACEGTTLARISARVDARTSTEDPFEITINKCEGILGQSVPIVIEVVNHTSDMVGVTSVLIEYRGKLIVPGEIDPYRVTWVPGGQSINYSVPLLWNGAPLQAGLTKYLQDRVVFRDAGDKQLRARLHMIRGTWGEQKSGTIFHTEQEYDVVSAPFTVTIAAPNDAASTAWWDLVSSDDDYAYFLACGGTHDGLDKRRRMWHNIDVFVRANPDHQLAQELNHKLEHDRLICRDPP